MSEFQLNPQNLDDLPAVRVARGASYFIMNDVVTTLVGLLTFTILVRLLTPTEIGVMATLLLVLEFSQAVVSFGLPSAMTKFVAQSGRSTATRLVRVGLGLVSICSFIAGGLIVGFSLRLSQYLTGTTNFATPFALLGFVVVSAGVYDTLSGILLGRGKIKELATLDAARFILQQTAAAGLVVLGWKLSGVMIGWIFGYAFFALTGCIAANDGLKVIAKNSGFSFRRLLCFSAPLYGQGFASFVYIWLDRALLLLFVPLSDVGIYNVAFVGFGIVASTPGAIAAALFPHYSKLSKMNRKNLEHAVLVASRYIALIVSPLALGLAVLAPSILGVVGGPTYQKGAVALAILSMSLFATLSYYSLGSILLALNRPGKQSLISIMIISVSLVTGLIFIPRLGMNGSALARGAGMVFGLIVTTWVVKKEIALRFDRSAILKSVIAASIMALIVLFLEVALRSIFLLPAYILTGALVYVLALRFEKSFSRADIKLFKAFAGVKLGAIVERFGDWLLTESDLSISE